MTCESDTTDTDVCDRASHPNGCSVELSACTGRLNGLERVGEYAHLTHLDLGNKDLLEFPAPVARLTALETLFIGGNRFAAVPPLTAMRSLRFIGMRNCRVTEVDGSIYPKSLEALVLTDNAVATVRNLKTLPKLRKLMLAHNNLAEIDLNGLDELELLRLSNNPELEVDFGQIARLPKLAWVALSGTKSAVHSAGSVGGGEGLPVIREAEVAYDRGTFEESLLGGGSSGDVASGRWGDESVVVKKFRDVCSDGLASDEVSLMGLVRGLGESVVRPLAVILREGDAGARDDPDSVVIQLFKGARALGDPPSLKTVVRDLPAGSGEVTPELLVAVARGVSAAMRQLSGRGVAHGDLYAHNVLVAGRCEVKLSDFGAAWRVPEAGADAVERVEMRAFGYLLQDALTWCSNACSSATREAIEAVVDSCLDSDPSRRPNFRTIEEKMLRLQM
ncbi:Tyrosine protein-kinase src-2 [Diplonema papillatum]|nr:Tyrosine protein-kinase src-2 [Diplonema papillatum]